MKKTFQIILLSGLMILSVNTYAKGQSGIYLTLSDYTNKKLTQGAKIHPNNSVINTPYITITDNGKKQKLKKSEVFGYVDDKSNVYRFYKNEAYQIAEAGNIMVYVQKERNSQTKEYKVISHYYFSTMAGSEIIPLTLDNLKNVYRSNNRFLDLVDQFFSKSDVTAYDNIHNTYKVNYVFGKAMKE